MTKLEIWVEYRIDIANNTALVAQNLYESPEVIDYGRPGEEVIGKVYV